MPMRRAATALASAVAVLLAGCTSRHAPDTDADDAPAVETFDVPDSAPKVPDLDELTARGFDCRELPVGDFSEGDEMSWLDGQSHEVCLLSDGVIAASWSMKVYEGHVLAWDYFAWPRGQAVDTNPLTLSHMKALQTVFDTLLPQDFAVLGPAMAEWTTPADTATWDFDGAAHVGIGGPGLMDFSAVLVDKPEAMSLSAHPATDGPELDAEAFVKAADEAGWSSCEAEDRGAQWGHYIKCDLGDFHIMVNVRSDGILNSFSITNYGSPEGTKLLGDLAEVAGRTGSDTFAGFVGELTQASATGGEKFVWVGGVPALIRSVDHPDNLDVDAQILLDPPS